jgi:DNA-binding transcriptional regulator YhcF (GntR family)
LFALTKRGKTHEVAWKLIKASSLFNAMADIEDNGVRKRRDTRSEDRRVIFFHCRMAMVDGALTAGTCRELARQLGFKPKTISRQWRAMRRVAEPLLINQPEDEHLAIIEANAHKIFRTGHWKRRKGKLKYDPEQLVEAIKALPLKQRMTVRHTAGSVGVPVSTIQRMLRPPAPKPAKIIVPAALEDDDDNFTASKLLVRHSSNIHPTLTADNKMMRFLYCLEQINPATMGLRHPKFFGQFDKVHIDEKWFHLCRDGERYILAPDEQIPVRHTKHKGYILKVMFLCAKARPRWDPTKREMWDGKLGIWPIGAYTIAKRTSKNRPAGTQEWKNDTVDREAYKEMLKEKVIQSIIEKWPAAEWSDDSVVIKIQQDGAGGHCKEDDEEIAEYIQSIHLEDKVKLYTQPANSPDLNILDLGLFNAIQAAYYRTSPRNQVQLIEMVEKTYKEFSLKTINRVWLSLMCCFNEIIEMNGDNDYKVPHMGKARLERLNLLPTLVEVSDSALQVAQLRAAAPAAPAAAI